MRAAIQLSRIEAQNYRCFETIDLSTGPINIFIGPNNSGKTALLHLILALSRSSKSSVGFGAGDPVYHLPILGSQDRHLRGNDAQSGSVFWTFTGVPQTYRAERSATDGSVTVGTDIGGEQLGMARVIEGRRRVVEGSHGREVAQAYGRQVEWLPVDRLSADVLEEPAVTLKRVAEAIFRFRLRDNATHVLDSLASHYRPLLSTVIPTLSPFPWFDFDNDGHAAANLMVRTSDLIHRRLADLGAAVSELLLLSYITMDGRSRAVLVDEPENHLHPALIRSYLATLSAKVRSEGWQLFLSTHSNHVLDALADDAPRVFMTSHDGVRASVQEITANDATRRGRMFELFHRLGIRPSSGLQTHCLLWVEGPSDAIYLRAWLNLTAQQRGLILVENVDFGFAFFGGSNLARHVLAEDSPGQADADAKALVDMIAVHRHSLVIADSDRGSSGAELGKAYLIRLRVEHPARVWITGGREVENYIPAPLLDSWIDKRTELVRVRSVSEIRSGLADAGAFVEFERLIAAAGSIDTPPDRVKARDTNKVELAMHVADGLGGLPADSQWLLDMKTRCGQLVDFIMNAKSGARPTAPFV